MRRTLFLKGCFVLGAVFFCFVSPSCKKEEIPGPKGEPGTPGGGGNAGINTSGVITIASSQWQANADSSAWVLSIPTTLITQNVVDKGAVKVYILKSAAWWELPLTQGDLFTQFGFEVGKVNLEFVDVHGELPDKPTTSEYRIVVLSESARTVPLPNVVESVINKELSHQ